MSNFKIHEIIGFLEIDGRKVTYLKTGVKRIRKYNDHIEEEEMTQLNHPLLWVKQWQEYYRKVVGIDDFERDT